MADNQKFDLVVKNARVVRPRGQGTEALDLGVAGGKFVQVAPALEAQTAKQVVDAKGMLIFPGVVDAHMHAGIYHPLQQDAVTESKAAATGGVTSMLTYFRTGQYYLNQGGPYRDFYPRVLDLSKENYFVDYGYHIAPISGEHIREMEMLATEFGVPSFKIFMFYGGHGLHGRSDKQNEFLMLGPEDRYDIAHFEFIMREATAIMQRHPDLRDYVSVSLHCELADILTAYTKIVEREGKLKGLHAYSESRPQHSEGLAVWIASYLANETNCANINLLHLSSRKAMEAALTMQKVFPHINFKREVTVGHLLLDWDAPTGNLAKVNPPIRPREDVEFLWQAVLNGDVAWIVSDHACCSRELKLDPKNPDDITGAKSGFGGTEYLLSGIFSEGCKRGLTYNRIAELICWNPAQRFGLLDKGDIAAGYDADFVLFDPNESFVVHGADSPSGQGYTPFEGVELTGKVKGTFVRGSQVYDGKQIVGVPGGQYLKRPCGQKKG